MQGTPYTRVPASEAAREFIYALKRETLSAYVIQTWGSWDEAAQRENFDRNFDPNLWELILVDGARAGAIALEWEPSRLFLANIELLPAWQRRGLGTALLTEILAEARRRGLPVELRVLRVNPAQHLYTRMGFSITQASREYLWMHQRAT